MIRSRRKRTVFGKRRIASQKRKTRKRAGRYAGKGKIGKRRRVANRGGSAAYNKGFDNGFDQAYNEGFNAGYAQGMEQGQRMNEMDPAS
jgi:hypothetical protein